MAGVSGFLAVFSLSWKKGKWPFSVAVLRGLSAPSVGVVDDRSQYERNRIERRIIGKNYNWKAVGRSNNTLVTNSEKSVGVRGYE